MANCKFPAGIEHVSGTLSKKTIRTADGTITQRVFACMRNGKQRIYFRKDGPRTTPLSEKEKQARVRFAQAARYYKNLSTEQMDQYRELFSKTGGVFNGKKYSTLRGFIIARCCAEMKECENE